MRMTAVTNLMFSIWVTNCVFKHTARILPLGILHKMLSAGTTHLFRVCVLFFYLPLHWLGSNLNHFSDYHPSTYLNCTLWDLCTNGKPFISPVTQICCHVNSCPDRPRYSATRSNRRTEGINMFTFGLCTSVRLKFRGSLGWRVKLMTGVPHRKNQSLSNKQCSFASQTFLFPLVAWDLFRVPVTKYIFWDYF